MWLSKMIPFVSTIETACKLYNEAPEQYEMIEDLYKNLKVVYKSFEGRNSYYVIINDKNHQIIFHNSIKTGRKVLIEMVGVNIIYVGYVDDVCECYPKSTKVHDYVFRYIDEVLFNTLGIKATYNIRTRMVRSPKTIMKWMQNMYTLFVESK